MKILKYNFLILFLVTLVFGCGKKETDPNKIIAGETSKKWKADKETTSSGEKDKLDKEEKKEVMEFYQNGNFTMDGSGSNSKGTWTYDQGSKNLGLQFAGTTVSENFAVLELENDKIKLKAADGSTMVLDSE